MKPPRKLRIAHATFTVEHSDKECGDHDAGGLTFGDQRRIVLPQTQDEDKSREVVLHELLHACIHVAGVEFSDAAEEKFVRATTGPLLCALRDNPKLLSFITATEDRD